MVPHATPVLQFNTVPDWQHWLVGFSRTDKLATRNFISFQVSGTVYGGRCRKHLDWNAETGTSQ